MTPDQMPAGPEMDFAVARAIGWERWQPVNGVVAFPVAPDSMHDEFEPSTNIAHAMEVAELLRKDFWLTIKDMRVHYYVTLSKEIGERIPPAFATAQTLPLAICRAALKAVTK